MQGGQIDATGGAGGKGAIVNAYPSGNNYAWDKVSGGGGGGGGGTIALISGDAIDLSAAIISAMGGAGGPRATTGTTLTSTKDNKGGDGGKGYIFLMDADGEIDGFLPQGPETGAGKELEYDSDSRGVITISPFDASRFSSITAITELFPVTAAKPAYVQYNAATDIVGFVANPDQRIRVRVSAAESNPENPTVADPTTEIPDFEIAILQFGASGTAVVVTGDMENLNATPGTPDRRAFRPRPCRLRVRRRCGSSSRPLRSHRRGQDQLRLQRIGSTFASPAVGSGYNPGPRLFSCLTRWSTGPVTRQPQPECKFFSGTFSPI